MGETQKRIPAGYDQVVNANEPTTKFITAPTATTNAADFVFHVQRSSTESFVVCSACRLGQLPRLRRCLTCLRQENVASRPILVSPTPFTYSVRFQSERNKAIVTQASALIESNLKASPIVQYDVVDVGQSLCNDSNNNQNQPTLVDEATCLCTLEPAQGQQQH